MEDYSLALDWQAKMWRFLTPEAAHGWAAPYMEGMDAQGRESLNALAHSMVYSIRESAPFYCSQKIQEVIESFSPTVPLNWAPDRTMFPVDDGFVWFERPSAVLQQEAKYPINAMSWTLFNRLQSPGRSRQGVDFFLWGKSSNTYALYPYQAQMWRFGEPIEGLLQSDLRQTIQGQEPEIGEETHALRLRFFAAFLTFINDRITSTRRTVEPNRATRRRYQAQTQQELVHPVRVIELRAREYEVVEREGELQHRDFACQWIVRGHWRNQWYPSLGRHQPKWITPYVKGPDDKPLKTPRANVFAVVR